jgi:hypothetical protein
MQTREHWSENSEFQGFPFVPCDTTDRYIAQLRQDQLSPSGGTYYWIVWLGENPTCSRSISPIITGQKFTPDLHHRVVYIDAAFEIPILAATLSSWCTQGYEGILVVDNCHLHLHQQLQTCIQHSRSRFSLLTLDYNPDEKSDVPTIRIEQSPDSLIQAILKLVYKNLPDAELDRIARYAQGFPQMAVLLAKARLKEDREMGNLRDDILLEKLLWGCKSRNDQARKVISACALFEHLGFTADREEEYRFVASHIARIDADDFYRHVKEFQQRGVIDERGRYIRVVPLPLAVRLAADWWQGCSPTRASNSLPGTCQATSQKHCATESPNSTSSLKRVS